jgi:hypothetical protein
VLLQVENRHTLPADVVVLSVAEKTEIPHGICYVETKSLDGGNVLSLVNRSATSERQKACLDFDVIIYYELLIANPLQLFVMLSNHIVHQRPT